MPFFRDEVLIEVVPTTSCSVPLLEAHLTDRFVQLLVVGAAALLVASLTATTTPTIWRAAPTSTIGTTTTTIITTASSTAGHVGRALVTALDQIHPGLEVEEL
jgi:hypothetical protein